MHLAESDKVSVISVINLKREEKGEEESLITRFNLKVVEDNKELDHLLEGDE